MDKQDIRERMWDVISETGVARFPFPPHGRIPNFEGADEAADRLANTDEWGNASAIKANPDSPQRPVRRRALASGMTVYMAVPRLRDERCFIRLSPDEIEDIDRATTIAGSSEVGVPVAPGDVDPIDLVVVGSVAVNEDGDRIGKGEGYSDLEYAFLRELDLVDDSTPVATTVHETQLLHEPFAVADHDVSMDVIATPSRVVRPSDPKAKPRGIRWADLDGDRIEEIPALSRFQSNSRE